MTHQELRRLGKYTKRLKARNGYGYATRLTQYEREDLARLLTKLLVEMEVVPEKDRAAV